MNEGDKVVCVWVDGHYYAVPLSAPAAGDKVVTVPLEYGQVAVPVCAPAVGDHVLMVPTDMAQYIALTMVRGVSLDWLLYFTYQSASTQPVGVMSPSMTLINITKSGETTEDGCKRFLTEYIGWYKGRYTYFNAFLGNQWEYELESGEDILTYPTLYPSAGGTKTLLEIDVSYKRLFNDFPISDYYLYFEVRPMDGADWGFPIKCEDIGSLFQDGDTHTISVYLDDPGESGNLIYKIAVDGEEVIYEYYPLDLVKYANTGIYRYEFYLSLRQRISISSDITEENAHVLTMEAMFSDIRYALNNGPKKISKYAHLDTAGW